MSVQIRPDGTAFVEFEKPVKAVIPGQVAVFYDDMLPKPKLSDIPLIVTGHSGQSPEWIAEWIYYPRRIKFQKAFIDNWRSLTDEF